MAQGYTLADIAKMRDRFEKMKGTLGAKANKNFKTKEDEFDTGKGRSIKDESILSKKKIKKGTEDSVFVSKVFGDNLFNNEELSFEPNLKIATPKNYQLGPDDELNIDIFGDVLDNFKVIVSTEGTVKILNLSPIYVNGLSIDAASERIVSRLRQLYQGLNKPGSGSSAQVTLGDIRSIKITLTGEVKTPGTYTVSSLATVFNALYLAGGPSENGSYRNIKVVRGNKVVRTLDLYDFLLKGDQKDNIHLQDQDVIRIADYESRIDFKGEVKRPLIFETIKGETFKDLVRFAGGFTNKAYTYSINVQRNTSRELKLMNITQDEVDTFLPQNGDKYTVGKIIERFENRVSIGGAVFRPGYYAIENGLTSVKDLVKKAEGLRENAFLNRASIHRKKENYDPELISLDLGKILRGEASDISLHREDSLAVFFADSLRELKTVKILGDVNKPGEFEYREGMKVADIIQMANGLKESASYSKLELARRVITHGVGDIDDSKIEIKTFNIDGSYKLSDEGNQEVLLPFDVVSIRTAPNYEVQRSVSITGMVNYPGSYAIQDQKQRISDIIFKAGGLREESFLDGAKLYRDSSMVGVNLTTILENPGTQEDLLMLSGDLLEIPRLTQTVKLTGGVQNPVAVSFKNGFTMREYISEGGGYTANADRSIAYVKYANGVSKQIKHYFLFRVYPKIITGSEIIVPEIPANQKKGMTAGEIIGLSASLSSLSITLIALINNLTK